VIPSHPVARGHARERRSARSASCRRRGPEWSRPRRQRTSRSGRTPGQPDQRSGGPSAHAGDRDPALAAHPGPGRAGPLGPELPALSRARGARRRRPCARGLHQPAGRPGSGRGASPLRARRSLRRAADAEPRLGSAGLPSCFRVVRPRPQDRPPRSRDSPPRDGSPGARGARGETDLANGRRAPGQHGRCRVQACLSRPPLPRVHLRRLRGAARVPRARRQRSEGRVLRRSRDPQPHRCRHPAARGPRTASTTIRFGDMSRMDYLFAPRMAYP